LLGDSWAPFFVTNSLVQDQPDQPTVSMGNGPDGLGFLLWLTEGYQGPPFLRRNSLGQWDSLDVPRSEHSAQTRKLAINASTKVIRLIPASFFLMYRINQAGIVAQTDGRASGCQLL
jgi:hypothetical protein